MAEKDGGFAFPRAQGTHEQGEEPTCGMSLRDYFAGQALTGYLASFTASTVQADKAAKYAYATADAMLLARESQSAAPVSAAANFEARR